jgi:hypothetical protein
MQTGTIRNADIIKVSPIGSKAALQNNMLPTVGTYSKPIVKLIPTKRSVPRDNVVKSIMCEMGISDVVEVNQILRTMLDTKQVSEVEYSALIEMANASDVQIDSYQETKQKLQDIYTNTKPYSQVEGRILTVLATEDRELFGNIIQSDAEFRGRRKGSKTKQFSRRVEN